MSAASTARLSMMPAASSLLVTLALGACATTPPPQPPPPVASATPVERPAPPPRPPASPPKPVDLHWAFSTGADACTAVASGPGGLFQVQTTAARQIMVTARFATTARAVPPRARPAKLSFNGAAGEWSMPGTWQRNEFTSTLPLDERGVASVLGLLGGGTAAISAGPLQVGSARLPSSGRDGSAWVQCPKQMIAVP